MEAEEILHLTLEENGYEEFVTKGSGFSHTIVEAMERYERDKKGGYGYLCSIEGEKIFVVAVNVADCLDQLEKLATGKNYQMETHSSVPIK